MRVSAKNPEHVVRYLVYVDGRDVNKHCYEADDEEGWADCYALNEDGRHYSVFSEDAGQHVLATERLTGDVEIRDMWTVRDCAGILNEKEATWQYRKN